MYRERSPSLQCSEHCYYKVYTSVGVDHDNISSLDTIVKEPMCYNITSLMNLPIRKTPLLNGARRCLHNEFFFAMFDRFFFEDVLNGSGILRPMKVCCGIWKDR